MNSVVSFTLDDFSVGLKGYTEITDKGGGCISYSQRYCSSLQTLLRVNCWRDCTVGKETGLEVDSDIRQCKYLDVHMYTVHSLIEEQQRKLVPVLYQNIISNDVCNDGFVALMYEKGGIFKPHRDSKTSDLHFATMILMPPSHYSPHEGGVLKIRDHEDRWLEFRSDNLESWTAVIFHPLLEHEVTEITSGTRLVFKQECLFDNDLYKLCRDATQRIATKVVLKLPSIDGESKNERLTEFRKRRKLMIEKLDIMDKFLQTNQTNEDRQLYDTEYYSLKDAIENIELDSLPDPEYVVHEYRCERGDTDYVLKRLSRNSRKVSIVVLNHYYPTGTVEWLYPDDYSIYEKVKAVYPHAFLKNYTERYVNGELSDYESLDAFNREGEPKANIIRIGNGRKTDSVSEYNDSDYDKVSWYSITCLVVVK